MAIYIPEVYFGKLINQIGVLIPFSPLPHTTPTIYPVSEEVSFGVEL